MIADDAHKILINLSRFPDGDIPFEEKEYSKNKKKCLWDHDGTAGLQNIPKVHGAGCFYCGGRINWSSCSDLKKVD
jgi:hypothetical protein